MRRVTLTTIVIASSFLSISLLGVAQFRKVLGYTLGAIILVDLVAVAAHPNAVQGFSSREDNLIGSWRGLHIEKNAAGAIAAASALIFSLIFAETRRWRWLVLAVLAVVFLYGTQSKTSLALLPVALLATLWYRYFYSNSLVMRATAVGLVLLLTAGAAILFWYLPELIEGITDPEAFTGRGQIWRILIGFIGDNWLLGSGYGSFWNIGIRSPVITYGHEEWIAELVYVGHNGYLDALAQLGAFGFLLTVNALLVWPLKTLLSNYSQDFRRENAIAFAVVVYCAMHNFQETSFLERDNPLWVTLLFAVALLRAYAPQDSQAISGNFVRPHRGEDEDRSQSGLAINAHRAPSRRSQQNSG